ncbi:hypothetical protein [Bacillus sp. USDA818B3_A]|nr:hypothetical protein [Bacillus sp. USDA818B3_A]
MEKSNTRQQKNEINQIAEAKSIKNEQVKEITEAQRDGFRFDYTDSSDFS